VIYDLWDSESGNIIGTFDTKEEALSVVRQALAKHGAEYVETLLFGQQDSRGQTKAIARGKKLVQIARGAAAAH
jgi:hypothetical protein